MIRTVLSHTLSKSPDLYVVAAVEDGEHAVRLARSGHIDVLVLDVEMPNMSGAEALPLIRRLAPAVLVVMHSSLSSAKHEARFRRDGAAAYVQKPCDIAHLVGVIREIARAYEYAEGAFGQ
jgi:DNA-binding NarL/FixJ family response regulator